MITSFVSWTFFCLLTISLADDCNNPLLTTYNFQKLGAPTSGSGLKFCKSLQNGQTCCSADTINSIQDKITALSTKLSTAVAARDKALAQIRDELLPDLRENIYQLRAYAATAVQVLDNNDQNEDSTGSANVGSSSMIPRVDYALSALYSQIDKVLDLKSSFNEYQKSRTSCVVELLKLQSSAWCLGCDPTYATKGVSGSAITISDRVCKRLQSSCYSFLSGAALQSEFFKSKMINSMFDKLISVFDKMTNNDIPGALFDLTVAVAIPKASSPAEPVKVPDGCTKTNCDWICKNLLVNGQIDEAALVLGGTVTDATGMLLAQSKRRLLEEQEEGEFVKNKLSKNRKLTGSEWDPDTDEAGVVVTFADDPAGVKTKISQGTTGTAAAGVRIMRSGFVCIVVSLIALFFL